MASRKGTNTAAVDLDPVHLELADRQPDPADAVERVRVAIEAVRDQPFGSDGSMIA